jgi:OOP family OmpA-OmpF porin
MTDGHSTALASPFVADLGVRYMFSNKFGLKADFGYNNFKDAGSGKFDLNIEQTYKLLQTWDV